MSQTWFGEAECLEQLGRARLRGVALQAEQAAQQNQVLPPGQVLVDRCHLAGEADQPADGVRLLDDVVAKHLARALIRREQRRQHADRRRLAGAVRSEDAVDRSGTDGQVDAVDSSGLAKRLHEAVGLDREWGMR